MFRVFEVPREVEGKPEKGYQIFWCPSAPMHYADKIPHDNKVYSKKQAAYRRRKQLQDALNKNVIPPRLSLKQKGNS
jgi:hypothetical protein